ncbi:MAG: 2-oxoacid:acceptor oxidoreductase family protein [Asgard group archaeon]|nr:2-oxoacid:acceptor oxidoreductase family protein [Asgard group archaeon]
MTDIRFHGRGGQGVVTASRLAAEAALVEDKYVHAFPAFGPERAGAPIEGFTRISAEEFSIKTEIHHPDIIVILDPSLIGAIDLGKGLKDGGIVIANYPGSMADLKKNIGIKKKVTYHKVNATKIADEELGRPITNTVMLGALVKVTGIVKLDNVCEATAQRFKGTIGEKNVRAIKRAYKEVKSE